MALNGRYIIRTCLEELDGDIKSAILHKLSILIAQVAADNKLTWSDGAMSLSGITSTNLKLLHNIRI